MRGILLFPSYVYYRQLKIGTRNDQALERDQLQLSCY